MKRCKMIVLILALIAPVACRAETVVDKGYYAVVLERRNAIQDRSIDAIVFTRAGSTYRFIRRLDENYRLILNASSGNVAPAVTAGNFPRYDAMIRGNHLTPRTIRDKSGRELAIVYCGLNPCYIDRVIRRDGSVLLDLKSSVSFEHETLEIFGRRTVRD